MDKLKQKIESLTKALNVLERFMQRFHETASDDHETYEERRSAVIQSFEVSFDLFWKTLKDFLTETHGISDVSSPKSIFKKCFDLKIISEIELNNCNKLGEDRNNTTHTYNEEIADEVVQGIAHHYQLMRTIADRINKK